MPSTSQQRMHRSASRPSMGTAAGSHSSSAAADEETQQDAVWPDLAPKATRKVPRTRRERLTVDSVIRGAVAVLERDGLEAFSTTSVAIEAHVAIGTLYRYFPDRTALLVAVAARNRHLLVQTVRRSDAVGVSALCTSMVAAYREDAALRILGLGTYGPKDQSNESRAWSVIARISGTDASLCRLLHASIADAFRHDAHGDPQLLRTTRIVFMAEAHTAQGAVPVALASPNVIVAREIYESLEG